MFTQITSHLKSYDEFRTKSSIDAMSEFSHICSKSGSCKEPTLENTKYAEDKVLQDFVSIIILNRNRYYKEHLNLATKSFNYLKEMVLNFSSKDLSFKSVVDELLGKTNSAVKALTTPELIVEQTLTFYKLKNSSFTADPNATTNISNSLKVVMKCILALIDSSGRSVVMDESELLDGGDLYDRKTSITEKDFAGTGILESHYTTFKSVSKILQKIDSQTRKALSPHIRECYAHMVCCVVVSNKYIMSFADAPGKYFYFGVFLQDIRPYTELLQPLGFGPEIASIGAVKIEID